MTQILIVEDDVLIGRLYQKIFTVEGYQVEVAVDGQQGLDMVRTFKPTLILLDIMMPKLNGLQVLEKLKVDPETKNIPVVMLTNLSSQQDAEAALLKGAVKYIIKSEQTPKQVFEVIKQLLAAYTRSEIPPVAPA